MSPPPPTGRAGSRQEPVVLTVGGVLDVAAGAALCRSVLACLAREPVAVVVELSGMTVAGRDAAAVFPALLRSAETWPGTPLLLCAARPAAAALIAAAAGGPVPMFATVADGLATLRHHDDLISELILPVRGAARRARDVVTDACARWALPRLSASAVLVAGELVGNAVAHARTEATLQLRLRPRLLYVGVFDGADTRPVLHPGPLPTAPDGRGLHLVRLVSARWGCVPRAGGKVVWAALRT
ncbi:ATP-binding protein [Spirilliplanes yamanashiensis]|uniref:STAS domain-containing protein n=1 Tax=Spirilliplanes yamanashiensis TaxID=42233 RepID=A0A8J3YF34_9ACTN|nr:ATP-binding protein [Spirilliplanes yamanashiensis]MDP9815229.1 anti-anti-sigma regulatory factor [Spirilliplanes yamanashiensis]GIJ06503.1 hypothetical protein Sya03_58550 [Spirilliplanes yamanashiensis]